MTSIATVVAAAGLSATLVRIHVVRRNGEYSWSEEKLKGLLHEGTAEEEKKGEELKEEQKRNFGLWWENELLF